MLFPLSIIEPCLEKAGVPIEVPPDWALRTFSYASSDTSAIEEDDGEQALLVASFSQALKMAGDGQTRPVLAVTAADDAKDPAVDSGRAAFPPRRHLTFPRRCLQHGQPLPRGHPGMGCRDVAPCPLQLLDPAAH